MRKEFFKKKYRYEKKFVIPKFYIDDFEIIKSFLKIELEEVYNSRRVNSIYYDTDNYQYASQNVQGLAERKKIRIRYYGSTNNIQNPQLEVKSKLGNVGSKFSLNLDKSVLEKNKFSLLHLKDDINFPRNLIDEIYIIKPKLLVSYKRRYFQSICSNYRFTFDTDIAFLGIEQINQLYSIDMKIFHSNFNNIIELKYDCIDQGYINRLDLNLPFRLTSNSKYLLGLNELGLYS